jgi:hypothetical protein
MAIAIARRYPLRVGLELTPLRSDTRTMPSNGTYGGQGKAVAVDPLGGFAVFDRERSDNFATFAAIRRLRNDSLHSELAQVGPDNPPPPSASFGPHTPVPHLQFSVRYSVSVCTWQRTVLINNGSQASPAICQRPILQTGLQIGQAIPLQTPSGI